MKIVRRLVPLPLLIVACYMTNNAVSAQHDMVSHVFTHNIDKLLNHPEQLKRRHNTARHVITSHVIQVLWLLENFLSPGCIFTLFT